MGGLFGSGGGGGRYQVDPPKIYQGYFKDPYSQDTQQMLLDRYKLVGDRELPSTQYLRERASGEAPSIARNVLRQETDRNLAGTVAQTLANRGAGAGLGARNALRAMADINQQAAGQGVIADLQERYAAQNALVEAELKTMGLNDAQISTIMSQLMTQREADRQALMDYQSLKAQSQLAASGIDAQAFADWQARRGAGVNQAVGAGMGVLSSLLGFFGSDAGAKTGIESAGSSPIEPMLEPGGGMDFASFLKGPQGNAISSGVADLSKSFMSAARDFPRQTGANPYMQYLTVSDVGSKMGIESIGSLASALPFLSTILPSDENQKMNIRQMLDTLDPYTYQYKNPVRFGDPGDPNKRFVGVMAQDLERAGPIGESMVVNTPEGKMIDGGKGVGALLAAATDLNDRVKELETMRRVDQAEKSFYLNPAREKALREAMGEGRLTDEEREYLLNQSSVKTGKR